MEPSPGCMRRRSNSSASRNTSRSSRNWSRLCVRRFTRYSLPRWPGCPLAGFLGLVGRASRGAHRNLGLGVPPLGRRRADIRLHVSPHGIRDRARPGLRADTGDRAGCLRPGRPRTTLLRRHGSGGRPDQVPPVSLVAGHAPGAAALEDARWRLRRRDSGSVGILALLVPAGSRNMSRSCG